MGGSRTVKTLTVLFVAMTLGALALMLLEVPPISAGAAETVYDTASPIARGKWQAMVVHAATDRTSPVAQGSHFVIERGPSGQYRVTASDAWRKQQPGRHVGGPWQAQSVGVCVIGDFSQQGPDQAEFECLMDLVNALQDICRIPAQRVYLMRDLDARSTSPGRFFPTGQFSARLLK